MTWEDNFSYYQEMIFDVTSLEFEMYSKLFIEVPNLEVEKFYSLVKATNKPLWERCVHLELFFTVGY